MTGPRKVAGLQFARGGDCSWFEGDSFGTKCEMQNLLHDDFREPIRGAECNRGYSRIVDPTAIAQIGITGDIHTNE